ncbi:Cbp1 family collagen-binding glycoprotein adhesin [Dysgonomonas termitidis]|uniref:Chromosome partition protein Smc n=1 Tax=Dysgonomonas termitidis TaxID=1516126 RepID=A0ABV9L200_9BACT
MKKLFVGCFCLLALASCNVKNSDEYKALQAQRDSLLQVSAQGNTELAEMNSLINDVEENFRQIREAEKYLTIESKSKGEMSNDTKTRVRDNFEMINEILKKNKADIDKLNQRLKGNSGQMAGLKSTIERLNAELTERANTISELQSSLATRDAQIASLQTDVKSLTENVDNLSTQTAEQASKIKEQDKELNTAYYMFGTSKELKEAKVVTGGFLASNKILNEGIEKSKFIKVDIRDTQSIPVYDKKAKLLSDHPKDSYTLDKDASGKVVIKVTDYKRFWSLTKFLVVEVG